MMILLWLTPTTDTFHMACNHFSKWVDARILVSESPSWCSTFFLTKKNNNLPLAFFALGELCMHNYLWYIWFQMSHKCTNSNYKLVNYNPKMCHKSCKINMKIIIHSIVFIHFWVETRKKSRPLYCLPVKPLLFPSWWFNQTLQSPLDPPLPGRRLGGVDLK